MLTKRDTQESYLLKRITVKTVVDAVKFVAVAPFGCLYYFHFLPSGGPSYPSSFLVNPGSPLNFLYMLLNL
jgi:hypothetical protein